MNACELPYQFWHVCPSNLPKMTCVLKRSSIQLSRIFQNLRGGQCPLSRVFWLETLFHIVCPPQGCVRYKEFGHQQAIRLSPWGGDCECEDINRVHFRRYPDGQIYFVNGSIQTAQGQISTNWIWDHPASSLWRNFGRITSPVNHAKMRAAIS